MKKMIVAGLAASALLGGAAEAQAFGWTETRSKTVHEEFFGGDSCADAYTLNVWVDGARNIQPTSLLAGHQMTGTDLWGDGHGPVQVVGVRSYGDTLTYTLKPVGGWCSSADPGSDYGWEIHSAKIGVRYQVRKRIVMGRNLAKHLSEQALARRFSWYGDANHGGWRCRISGNRGHCRHVFGIGDGVVIGVVKVRLIGRTGQKPVWSYKLNAKQIDEYCRYVSHAGNCVTRFKKRRGRISLPFWVRAKKI